MSVLQAALIEEVGSQMKVIMQKVVSEIAFATFLNPLRRNDNSLALLSY